MQAKLQKRKMRIVMDSLKMDIFMAKPCRKHTSSAANVNGRKEKFSKVSGL